MKLGLFSFKSMALGAMNCGPYDVGEPGQQ